MYTKQEHIHFVGIGGIGMSGIAQVLREQGYQVSGCDQSGSGKALEQLRALGCQIFTGHNATHVHNADVLVYSSAVSMHSPEVTAAQARGIPVIPRAIMLAELMRTKYSVAVSGAHGKTTTTSMISHILLEAGLQPTVIVGGVLKNLATNAQLGLGQILVAEADESDRSLLYLNPTMAVVTNIDAEHLDTYRDLDDIKQTFKDFLARLPFYGKAFVCIDDPVVQSILPLPHIRTTRYGMSESADVRGIIKELAPSYSVVDVVHYSPASTSHTRTSTTLGTLIIHMPGTHNVQNALAATAVALECGVSFATIAAALDSFKGVERRFELKGSVNDAQIFDDYGHHPTEILHTLRVARRRCQGRLHVAFQPHRFSRTHKLWAEFVQLFAAVDQGYTIDSLYITDIYPASEQPLPGITSVALVQAIKDANKELSVTYCQSYEQIASHVINHLAPGDLLLTVGAGKVNIVGDLLLAGNQLHSTAKNHQP